MKMLTQVLFAAAAIAIAALGWNVASLQAETTAQAAVIDKQSMQLSNKQLEVDGMALEIKALNRQTETAIAEGLLVADLNTQHQQNETIIRDQHQVAMLNANQLKVSEHDPTRAWAAAVLPDAAGQLLNKASRSSDSHGDTYSHAVATIKFPGDGLPSTAI